MKQKHSISSSFGYAIDGIIVFFKFERNAKIQLVLLSVAVGLGLYFNITKGDWCAILLCGGLVLSMEITNSAIESIMDLIHPEKHSAVKRIKDLMAGGVLIASIISIVIALIVFLPRLTDLISSL